MPFIVKLLSATFGGMHPLIKLVLLERGPFVDALYSAGEKRTINDDKISLNLMMGIMLLYLTHLCRFTFCVKIG